MLNYFICILEILFCLCAFSPGSILIEFSYGPFYNHIQLLIFMFGTHSCKELWHIFDISARTCAPLWNIANGYIDGLQTEYGRIMPGQNLTFKCDEGFRLIGNKTFWCNDHGQWIPESQTPMCILMPVPSETSIVFYINLLNIGIYCSIIDICSVSRFKYIL